MTRTDQIVLSAECIATFCPGRADRHRQDITLGLPEVAYSPFKLYDPFEAEKPGVCVCVCTSGKLLQQALLGICATLSRFESSK